MASDTTVITNLQNKTETNPVPSVSTADYIADSDECVRHSSNIPRQGHLIGENIW